MFFSEGRGLTLIELLVALLVASVILFMGVPTLTELTNQLNFGAIQRSLMANLSYARSEAVTQGYPVTLCASTDGLTCSPEIGDWSAGWIIFYDADDNSIYEPDYDQIIRSNSIDSVVSLSWSGAGNIVFNGDGTVDEGRQGLVAICDTRGGNPSVKGVRISLSGRVNVDDSGGCNELKTEELE